jgi:hypothetical protein
MSPKGPCVEFLVPSTALMEGGGTFKRWGLVGGAYITRECAFEEDNGTPVSFSFCFLVMR